MVSDIYKKTKKVLGLDQIRAKRNVDEIISSEVLYVLSQYFEVCKNSYKSNISVGDSGEFDIVFCFKAKEVFNKGRDCLLE